MIGDQPICVQSKPVCNLLKAYAPSGGPPVRDSMWPAPLAQSAERFHGKEKVVGSIPTGGSHCAGGRVVRLAEHAGVAQLVRAHDS